MCPATAYGGVPDAHLLSTLYAVAVQDVPVSRAATMTREGVVEGGVRKREAGWAGLDSRRRRFGADTPRDRPDPAAFASHLPAAIHSHRPARHMAMRSAAGEIVWPRAVHCMFSAAKTPLSDKSGARSFEDCSGLFQRAASIIPDDTELRRSRGRKPVSAAVEKSPAGLLFSTEDTSVFHGLV